MKQVKNIPAAESHMVRDPWLDKVLDGRLRQLGVADWSQRYAHVRSAASAIKQAARKRGICAEVAIRGDDLYVRGFPCAESENGQTKVREVTPKKAPARKRVAKAMSAVVRVA